MPGPPGAWSELLEGDVADADAGDLPLVAQRDHLGELAVEIDVFTVGLVAGVEQPQVHRAELLDLEAAEVVLHAGAELLGPLRRNPGAVGVPVGADLADEHQVVGVWVQGGVDELVGDVGSVVLRGVDVVDAELDRASEDGEREVSISRRPEDAGAGELHGSEAEAGDLASAEEGRAAGSQGRRHRSSPWSAFVASASARHASHEVETGEEATDGHDQADDQQDHEHGVTHAASLAVAIGVDCAGADVIARTRGVRP